MSVRRPAGAQAAENRTGRLELTLLDEHGAMTAARVGIYDVGSGREVLASADAVPILRYNEGPGHRDPDLGESTGPARCSPRCSTATTTSADQVGFDGCAAGARDARPRDELAYS